jgi:hypothetical protein
MHNTLESTYRRLLLAYPRRYRRSRGLEMLTTLMDSSPADRTRPPLRQAVGLMAAGIACRLRQPRGFIYPVLATICALVLGFFAGAAGAWAGWQTAGPLPTAAEAAAISRSVVGLPAVGTSRDDFRFGFEGEPQAPGIVGGDDYTDGSVSFSYGKDPGSYVNDPDLLHSRLAAAVAQRLTAQGWVLDRNYAATDWYPTIPFLGISAPPTSGASYVVAHRGSVHLWFSHDTYGHASLRLSRLAPLSVPVLTYVGLVAGLLGGWLLAGWIARRTREQPVGLGAGVYLLAGFSVFLSVPAIFTVWCRFSSSGYKKPSRGRRGSA